MAGRDFKYRSDFGSAVKCPPDTAKPFEGVLYRFCRSPITDKDFVPQPILVPGYSLGDPCQRWGLSFFSTQAHARAKLTELRRAHKVFAKYIAAVQVSLDDGVATKPGNNGHLTLHEYRHVSFVGRATIVEELP